VRKEKLLLKFIGNLFPFTAKMLGTGSEFEAGRSDIHDDIGAEGHPLSLKKS
jgi:hypothetical protein